MFVASPKNHVEALQWLFDHGAQEDVRKPHERWFHTNVCASQNNHVEALQWLFDHGAQRGCSNTQQWWHTDVVASHENHVEALQWLFDHGAQEDVRHQRWVTHAVASQVDTAVVI